MGDYPRTDIIFGIAGTEGDELIPYDEETFEPLFSHYDSSDEDSWKKYYQQRADKPAESSGCTIGVWGYLSEPSEFLGIAATHYHCDWDSPGELQPDHLNHDVEAMTQQLRDFCEVMGIRWREPKWLVLSSHG